MEMAGGRKMKQWGFLFGCLTMASLLIFAFTDVSRGTSIRRVLQTSNATQSPRVTLRWHGHNLVEVNNGLAKVTFAVPGGHVVEIEYNGVENLLDTENILSGRGYWDIYWNKPDERENSIDRLGASTFRVVVENDSQVELSFSRIYNISLGDSVLPLNIDKRFVMLRGSSGFYLYGILEREEGWPATVINQIRTVFKLRKDMFTYMALSDRRQRIMPSALDRETGRKLAYPEAVLITQPSNPSLKGEVDDKYMYSCEDKDNKVHGWISENPPIGFWMITASDEFRMGGPHKQDLTSHVGPITLSMFVSAHYAGTDMAMRFVEGETWKKVFGPVFVYLNSIPDGKNPLLLWRDAKEQMWNEVEKWPYSFPESEDFPPAAKRGTVSGQLQIYDPYIKSSLFPANNAWVGVTVPGETGSWERQTKGYQHWTKTNNNGSFTIWNIRPGPYNFYAWVPGIIGDYKYEDNITIEGGDEIILNDLVYKPPRQGPTLWEIGTPDRTAAEFYVPEPYPTLMNRVLNHPTQRFRQYGLWERYADLYPDKDLVYTVGIDDYSDNWFFAHVNRGLRNKTYKATTWEIKFQLEDLNQTSYYTLQLALASATDSEIEIRLNNPDGLRPHFTTGLIGRDNAIARHGIHGLYWLYSVSFSGDLLLRGNNSIYLTQSRNRTPFQGVMYDYIRLEGPPIFHPLHSNLIV